MYGPPEFFARNRAPQNDDSRRRSVPRPPPPRPPAPFVPTAQMNSVVDNNQPANTAENIQATTVASSATENEQKVKAETTSAANNIRPSLQKFHQRYHRRETLENLELEFAKDVAYRRPTVYTQVSANLVTNPEVLTNYESLKEKYGDEVLDITVLENGESKPPFQTQKMLFKDFLTQWQTEETFGLSHYLQQRDLAKHFQGLIAEAGIAERGPHHLSNTLFPEEFCHHPTFYLGKKGIKTSLHYDRSCEVHDPHYQLNDPGKHNLFLQLTGSRRMVLFPMHLSEDLLPDEGSHWPHVSKSTTFLHTVLQQVPAQQEGETEAEHVQKQIQYLQDSAFPSLANAWPERMEIILAPGEALLIPARWWHYTEILEEGVALNWWFQVDDHLESKIAKYLASQEAKEAPGKERKCIIS